MKHRAEGVDEAFRPLPSTVPASATQSRASRKRAPTMKALEAEMVPKRKMGQARGGRGGRGRGERGVEAKSNRTTVKTPYSLYPFPN
jgi:hypothetical protein